MVAGDGGEPARRPLALDDDDRQTVRGPGDLDLLTGRVGRVVAAEHQDLVGVLVVRDEDLAVALVQRQQAQEVVVVTELAGLRLGGLLVRVEGGGAAEDRLSPPDDDVLGVAGRDGDLVVLVGGDGGEAQTARTVGPATGARGSGGRCGGLVVEPDDGTGTGGSGDRHHGGGAHHGSPRQGTGYHVADVLVVAGVRHFVETGVAAAVTAGEGGTSAGMRLGVQQRQQFAHFVLLRRTPRRQRVGKDPAVTLGAVMCKVAATR